MYKNQKGADHKSNLVRLNRIEGQVRGIKTMIQEEKYCIEILTQIKAIRSALKGLEMQILSGHVNHCLMNAITSGNPKNIEEKICEVMELIKKSSKS